MRLINSTMLEKLLPWLGFIFLILMSAVTDKALLILLGTL